MAYAVPAWVLGLIGAQVAAVVLAGYFGDFSRIELSPYLTFDSVWIATLLGLSVPVLAAILPIRSALGRSLQASLDVCLRDSVVATIRLSSCVHRCDAVPRRR